MKENLIPSLLDSLSEKRMPEKWYINGYMYYRFMYDCYLIYGHVKQILVDESKGRETSDYMYIIINMCSVNVWWMKVKA